VKTASKKNVIKIVAKMATANSESVSAMTTGMGKDALSRNAMFGALRMACVPTEPVSAQMASTELTAHWRDARGTVIIMELALPHTRWHGNASVRLGGTGLDVI